MYLDFIISLSLPISYVENGIFRSFSRAEENISVKSFRSTLFEVVKLVEISIRNEMNGTKGSVMHDSWTNNDSHFLGIYALYTKPVSVIENGKDCIKHLLKTPLLSLAPIPSRNEEGEIDSEHGINFNAESHIRQLEHVFNWYHVDVYEFCACQIADSCNLNKAIAKKMEIPHVGCANHRM